MFVVCDVHSDSKFDCLRTALRPIALNIVPPDNHVDEVERSIRTIKECLRSCVHGLPFKRLPKLFIHHMVGDAVRCLNSFPWRFGISSTLSPTAIVTGLPTPDYACMRLELGIVIRPTLLARARSVRLRSCPPAMRKAIIFSSRYPPVLVSRAMLGLSFPLRKPPSPAWKPLRSQKVSL
jgi:hypothetical protein